MREGHSAVRDGCSSREPREQDQHRGQKLRDIMVNVIDVKRILKLKSARSNKAVSDGSRRRIGINDDPQGSGKRNPPSSI